MASKICIQIKNLDLSRAKASDNLLSNSATISFAPKKLSMVDMNRATSTSIAPSADKNRNNSA